MSHLNSTFRNTWFNIPDFLHNSTFFIIHFNIWTTKIQHLNNQDSTLEQTRFTILTTIDPTFLIILVKTRVVQSSRAASMVGGGMSGAATRVRAAACALGGRGKGAQAAARARGSLTAKRGGGHAGRVGRAAVARMTSRARCKREWTSMAAATRVERTTTTHDEKKN
jgi:hypothetical protein